MYVVGSTLGSTLGRGSFIIVLCKGADCIAGGSVSPHCGMPTPATGSPWNLEWWMLAGTGRGCMYTCVDVQYWWHTLSSQSSSLTPITTSHPSPRLSHLLPPPTSHHFSPLSTLPPRQRHQNGVQQNQPSPDRTNNPANATWDKAAPHHGRNPKYDTRRCANRIVPVHTQSSPAAIFFFFSTHLTLTALPRLHNASVVRCCVRGRAAAFGGALLI